MPRTISGNTNDSSIRNVAPVAGRPCQRSIPSANATPSGTAMSTVVIPRAKALEQRRVELGVVPQRVLGSDHHHWRLNPCRTLLDRLPLNEIAIAIVSGTRDQTRYAHVTVCRILGLRHGSRHQRSGSYGDDGRTGGCGPRDRPLRHVASAVRRVLRR